MERYLSFVYFKKYSIFNAVFLTIVASAIFYWANSNNVSKKLKIESPTCPLSHFGSLFENDDQNIAKTKYLLTEHPVTTKDGYILKIFNVKLKEIELKKLSKEKQKNSEKIVLLQHPVMISADNFFYNKEKSIGFYLVNQGYDVWVGNNRGNKYSNRMTENVSEIKKSYEKFFDFSFVEMGLYDQPAVYKYILSKHSEEQQIYYIGHSQGTTQMFAGLLDEETTEYLSSKTKKFIASAPVVFINHTDQYYLQIFLKLLKLSQRTIDWLGITEFAAGGCSSEINIIHKIAKWFCGNKYLRFICMNSVPGVPFDDKYDNIFDDLISLMQHNPSGTSIKTLQHFAQLAHIPQDQFRFEKFNYGPDENLKRYGSENPPQWDLSKMKVDTVLINGTVDLIASKVDVNALYERLPRDKTKLYELEDWDHVTVLFAKDPTKLFKILDLELQ